MREPEGVFQKSMAGGLGCEHDQPTQFLGTSACQDLRYSDQFRVKFEGAQPVDNGWGEFGTVVAHPDRDIDRHVQP